MLERLNELSCNLLNSELIFHLLKRQVDTVRVYLVPSTIFLASLACIYIHARTRISIFNFYKKLFFFRIVTIEQLVIIRMKDGLGGC